MRDAVTPTDQDAAAERARQQHADRQWLYRRRRKRGLKPFTVDVYPGEIDSLVEHGILAEGERADQRAVGRALGRLLGVAVELLRKRQLQI